MYSYRRNIDESLRELERRLRKGDESARRPLIAAFERLHNWQGVFELLPKINPLILDYQDDTLPCGCNFPIDAIEEIPITQGYGALARCKHGELYAFLLNVHSIVEAYEAEISRLYIFKSFISRRSVGYYILDQQYSCSGVTIDSAHASHLKILPNGWLELRLWFPPEMVHSIEAFVTPINEFGVGEVIARIDPDDLDWWARIRGYLNF